MQKPNNCEKCPAVEPKKGEIICGCMRELKAKVHDPQEKRLMWSKCPLAWGKEEK
jgi:hypothetical protein